MFTQHTLETAPEGSRELMISTGRPEAVGKLAESPEMLGGFLQANHLFESSTLDPLSREVVVMTIATRNGCQVCIAMHTARLRQLKADPELITQLKHQQPLTDKKAEKVRHFTIKTIETTGDVSDDDLNEFLEAGYTRRNALEVILGIGTYTMSTFANRLVRA